MKFKKGKIHLLFDFFWFGCHIIEYWYKTDGVISVKWVPRHTFHFLCRSNGAVKGKDNCLDLNFHFLGFFFSYTDFDYGRFKINGLTGFTKRENKTACHDWGTRGHIVRA